MEEVYRDSAAGGCVEAAEPRDGLRNLHPELRLRRGPLRGSRPVATSTYPFLPNISRGEREEEKKKRHQHQESTTASRALGAIARTEEAPLLTSMFIWERSAAPEARSHRRFKRFLDAARLRGRPGVALPVAPRRSAAACGGPTARGGGRGGGSPERGRSAAAAAVRAGPRRYSAWWPAEGVVDCGLISKNFRGLFKKYSERGEWTADCISEKFENFYEK